MISQHAFTAITHLGVGLAGIVVGLLLGWGIRDALATRDTDRSLQGE